MEQALDKFDGYVLQGREIKLVRDHDGQSRSRSRSRSQSRAKRLDRSKVEKYGPPTRTNYRLIVENLSSRVSWQDLKDLMRRAGDVTYANAHNDRRNEG